MDKAVRRLGMYGFAHRFYNSYMTIRDLVRLREVRAPDVADDQKTASQIKNDAPLSVSEEDFQTYVLSQLKRVIHGDYPGTWRDDFVGMGIPSLHSSALASTQLLLSYIDEGPVEAYPSAYKETTGFPWPSDVTWYTDTTKTKKIVSKAITRNADQAPTSIVWTLYQSDGVTPVITATDTITNTGTPAVFEASRTRVIS